MLNLKCLLKRVPLLTRAYRNLRKMIAWLQFCLEFHRFKQLSSEIPLRLPLKWKNRYAFLEEKTKTPVFDHHYVYYTAWAARVLQGNKPESHVDISSSLYFSAITSAFIPIHFYDYRPSHLQLSNLSSEKTDLLSLPFEDESVFSLSCMHVVEHIGLGRYGEPLDPDGDLKAVAELQRVLAVEGTLLFVVPVGIPRVYYNAHRVYSYNQVMGMFEGFELSSFSLITDEGELLNEAPEDSVASQKFGCGCFEFKKLGSQ